MRTVLDEDTCTGQFQLSYVYRQQIAPVARLRVSKDQTLIKAPQVEEFKISRPGEPAARLRERQPSFSSKQELLNVAMPTTNMTINCNDRSIDDNHTQIYHDPTRRRTNPLSQIPNDTPTGQQTCPPDLSPHRHRVGRFQAPSQAPVYVSPLSPYLQQTTPKVYPNNTLVEDLSKCHPNLWPKSARATSKTIAMMKSCLPKENVSQTQDGQANGFTTIDFEAHDQNRVPAAVTPNHPDDCVDSSRAAASVRRQPKSKKNTRLVSKARMRRDYKFPMPPSISRLNSTLTQDDYDRALGVLTDDIRFQLHISLYRRIQTIWVLFSTVLCIFLPLLLSVPLETNVILGASSIWLLLQTVGLIVGSCCRKKLDRMLERSVAQVNSYFMDHKLMVGVINVGGLCERSRLVIPMVYFDTFNCIEQIESIVNADLKSIEADRNADKAHKQLMRQQVALDYSKIGFHQMEPNQRALAKSLAKKIVLRFSQRWISHFDRSKLMFTDDGTRPRHLSTGKCLCQFIEEHFKSDQREQIKDLDEPLDGCKAEMLAAPKLQPPEQISKPIGIVRRKISAQMSKLNGGKINSAAKESQQIDWQQQQQQQQVAKLAKGTEAMTRYDSDNEHDNSECDGNEDQDGSEETYEAAYGRTIINMPNGLNDKSSSRLQPQLNESKGDEPPSSAGALGLTLEANNATATNHDDEPHHKHLPEILVPTLSHLVGRVKGRQDLLKANQDNLDSFNSNYNSKLIEGFVSHLQQERIDSRSSPATDLSLELDCESLLNRNDDLIKKLKLLLESRAMEFSRGLEEGRGGSASTLAGVSPSTTTTTTSHNNSFNTKHYSTSNTTTIICDNQQKPTEHIPNIEVHLSDQTNHQNDASDNNNNHGSSINQISRKFFAQTDGIFFMSSKKSRQQRGVYVKPQQRMLEIC